MLGRQLRDPHCGGRSLTRLDLRGFHYSSSRFRRLPNRRSRVVLVS